MADTPTSPRSSPRSRPWAYPGSARTVWRHLHIFRATLVAPLPVPTPPSVRQVTRWLTRRPDILSEDERLELKNILDRSDVLTTTHRQMREFAKILTTRHGERLSDWMRDVDTRGARALRSLVARLRTDLDAVAAGHTLGDSSGAVEGTVNRIR
jgi:hypothetical protein